MWFSMMAFAGKAELNMLHAAAAMFLIPEVRATKTVARPSFSLRGGTSVNVKMLREIIQQATKLIDQTPDGILRKLVDETHVAWLTRKNDSYQKNLKEAASQLVRHLSVQFPTATPTLPEGRLHDFIGKYVDTGEAMIKITPFFASWDDNRLFSLYIRDFTQKLKDQGYTDFQVPAPQVETQEPPKVLRCRTISAEDLFS